MKVLFHIQIFIVLSLITSGEKVFLKVVISHFKLLYKNSHREFEDNYQKPVRIAVTQFESESGSRSNSYFMVLNGVFR
jgi:hypothetical protein